jgi:uncharacterized membrane protein
MTNKQGLPVGPSLDFGWNTFKDNAVFLVGVYLAAVFVPALIAWADEVLGGRMDFLMWFVHLFVTLVIEIGLVKIALKFEAGEMPEFANLFDGIERVPSLFVATLVGAAAVIAGLILLIVPGIIVGLRFMFVGFVVVDQKAGPIDALQKSWELTRGYTFDLFLFALAIFGINLLGCILFGVGVFVTMPVTALAMTRIYRVLCAQPAEAPAAGAITA